MAKKIKFPLIMNDNFPVRTIEELREHFNLTKAIEYFGSGKLQLWLEQRYYENEANALKELNEYEPDVYKKLCDVLGVEYHKEDIVLDVDIIKNRAKRLAELKQYTSEQSILDNVDSVAFNQEELAYLLDEDLHDIYLCNNTFHIPLKVSDKKYIGIGRVIAVIHSKFEVDFELKAVSFENISFDEKYNKICNPTPDELYQMGKEAVSKKDYEYAEWLYEKAIDMGNTDAMVEKGDCLGYNSGKLGGDLFCGYVVTYSGSEGLTYTVQQYKDLIIAREKESRNCYERAAQLGNSKAMYQLAEIFAGIKHITPTKDNKKSDYWYDKAMTSGDDHIKAWVAYYYYLDENKRIEGLRLLTEMAHDGNKLAMYYLATEYGDEYFGKSLDYKKAYQCYYKGEAWTDCLKLIEENGYDSLGLSYEEYCSHIKRISEEILKLNDVYGHTQLAIFYSKQSGDDNFTKCLDTIRYAYDNALSIYAKIVVYQCLGDIYQEKGMFDKAINAYKKALQFAIGRNSYYCDNLNEQIKKCEAK